MNVRLSAGLTLALLLASCGRPVAATSAKGVCPPQLSPLAGACLEHDEASAYCGKEAKPEGGGCARNPCSEGLARDLESGECVARIPRGTRTEEPGGAADAGALGTCSAETVEVVVSGPHRACLPRARTCGRGAHFRDAACHVDPACPPGSLAEADGSCHLVVSRSGEEALLDVGTWLRLIVGPDGGNGSSALCGPLALRPWLAGLAARETGEVDVNVDLIFPDNEVRDVRVTTVAERYDPHNASPPPRLSVEKYLDPMWQALRSIGGIANASSATVHVRELVDRLATAYMAPEALLDPKGATEASDRSRITKSAPPAANPWANITPIRPKPQMMMWFRRRSI